MKKLIRILFSLIIIVTLNISSNAQSETYDTLYNQALTPSGGLKTSTHFFSGGYETTYSCDAADDFITTQQWTITKVFALGGYYNGSDNPQNFNVVFYSDNNGEPGGEIYNTNNTIDYNGSDEFTVELDEPLVLSPGHYWVSISANTNLGNAQWGWKPSTGPYNSEAVWRNPADGFGTGYTDWTPITTVWDGTTETDFSFMLFGIKGTPASNPMPENNALNIDLNADIFWNNAADSDSIEVFFGTDPDNLTSIYYGTPVTTLELDPLDYYTKYYWQIFEINENGRSTGLLWNFTTRTDPSLPLYADFESSGFPPAGWYFETEGFNWWFKTIYSSYGQGDSCALEGFYSAPTGNQTSMITNIFPATIEGDTLSFDHAYASDLVGHVDKLEIFYSLDAGENWTSLILLQGGMNGELVTADPVDYFVPDPDQWGTQKFALPEGTNKLKFTGISAQGNNLYLDKIQIISSEVPVELSSFNAVASNGKVVLNWTTETETNNKGFEIERKNSVDGSQESEWSNAGFVDGNGTTSEKNNYTFVDEDINNGTYEYRLKQIDFDGSFEYSNIVNVEIDLPEVFSLKQNYPNPFNPSTKIKFSLPADSRVTLTVYNILGQKVRTLVNRKVSAGNHDVIFNASNLNSGVYLYRIATKGENDENFTSVKKMILTK